MTVPSITAEQIERTVERMTDGADRALMTSRISQAEYGQRMEAINEWAERAYRQVTVTTND